MNQICLCCDKKLIPIKQDGEYQHWQRKYHKTCWNERGHHYNTFEMLMKMGLSDKETIHFQRKKACLL
jgi:hypothetical protein